MGIAPGTFIFRRTFKFWLPDQFTTLAFGNLYGSNVEIFAHSDGRIGLLDTRVRGEKLVDALDRAVDGESSLAALVGICNVVCVALHPLVTKILDAE